MESTGRCERLNELSGSGCVTVSFPRRNILHGVNNYVKFNVKNKPLKGTPFIAVLSIQSAVFGDLMLFVLVDRDAE
jgi:hypothetical protein